MNKPFVSLRPEITREHALTLMDWLGDAEVTRYLSDDDTTSRDIARVVERVQLPILTHLFNQGGRFFMAYDSSDTPVGFVRLVRSGADCEIVLVIGEQRNWGRSLGASTIRAGLKLAFLEMRARNVHAKIHPHNARSIKGFERCGFSLGRESASLRALSLSSGRYFQLLRAGAMAGAPEIHVTELDKARLQELMGVEFDTPLVELEHEIERAIVVEPEAVAGDVVTMNSRLVLRLDDEKTEVALVYPQQADARFGKVSVLSELGTAILGFHEGDAVDWVVGERTRRIRIDKLLYQPESSGDLEL